MSIPFFYEPGCDANINVKLPRALLPEDTRDGRHPDWPADLPHYPFAAFLLNKLPLMSNPLLKSKRFRRATDDRFFIAIEAKDAQFDAKQSAEFVKNLPGCLAVEVIDDE